MAGVGAQTRSAPAARQRAQVVLQGPRIAVEVLLRAELGGIDEDRDRDATGLRPARSISRTWPSCRAPIVGTSPTTRPRSRRAGHRASHVRHRFQWLKHVLSPGGRLAAMRTIGIVQAIVGDQQVVEDLAPEDRPVHDAVHVLGPDPAVPDPLRVDHHGRPVLALLQAAGVVGTGQGPEPGRLQLSLERIAERLLAVRVAASPFVPGLTDIPAHEDVMGESRHYSIRSDTGGSKSPGTRGPDHARAGRGDHPGAATVGHSRLIEVLPAGNAGKPAAAVARRRRCGRTSRSRGVGWVLEPAMVLRYSVA